MNILKIKCHSCGDVLTDGEMRTHFFKTKGSKVTCYQCSQKIIEAKRQEYMDTVQDQSQRWGEPTPEQEKELEKDHYKDITNFEYL